MMNDNAELPLCNYKQISQTDTDAVCRTSCVWISSIRTAAAGETVDKQRQQKTLNTNSWAGKHTQQSNWQTHGRVGLIWMTVSARCQLWKMSQYRVNHKNMLSPSSRRNTAVPTWLLPLCDIMMSSAPLTPALWLYFLLPTDQLQSCSSASSTASFLLLLILG